jgi:PKD repeat protein
VPQDQYGDPGPEGTYDHWDQITLNPPDGAASAEIRLLFQPTSWEYVQFLYLANDGNDPELGTAGQDYLDAWLATGMAEPHVMATATWLASGPVNQPPTASFTASCTELACGFDASASVDPDGSILTYEWDLGDGTTATGVTASHTYAVAGTYTVTLTVTDDGGLTATATQDVTVSTGNVAPTAGFTVACTDLACTFDANASSDTDGTIVSYAWDFGDGAAATGVTAIHSYAVVGTYTVTLTVTDDEGATGTLSQTVTAGNLAPTASFTSNCTDLACTFDASASADPDGTIVSYAWDFGDGTTATGVTTSRVYAAEGTYTVALTVTDNGGLTAVAIQAVTVTAPGIPGPGPGGPRR